MRFGAVLDARRDRAAVRPGCDACIARGARPASGLDSPARLGIASVRRILEAGTAPGLLRSQAGEFGSMQRGVRKKMVFIAAVLLFVIVVGMIDAGLPWPDPRGRP
jgi:hypothetical protein